MDIKSLLSTANKSRNNTQVSEALDKLATLLTTEEAITNCVSNGGIAAALNSLTKPHKGIQLSALRFLVQLAHSKEVKKTFEKSNK